MSVGDGRNPVLRFHRRVHFHLWAAGGRLTPTWRDVAADSDELAIAEAKRQQRRSDLERGRCPLGYFGDVLVDGNAVCGVSVELLADLDRMGEEWMTDEAATLARSRSDAGDMSRAHRPSPSTSKPIEL